MNDMTLPSRHRIQYSSPDSLRVSGKETLCFFELKSQSGVQTRDPRLSKQAALVTAPGPSP